MPDTPFRFTTEIPMRWVDIDSAGILNNAVYLSLVEQARFEYFTQLDLLENGEFPIVLGETTLRYHRSGRAGMRLTVALRTGRLGGKSFDQHCEIRHGEDLLCSVKATLVWIDLDGGRTREIPDRARDIFSSFEGIARGPS